MKGPNHAAQRGLTMVELLVAMTVGLVITMAALSMLVLGRSGYDAVDSATQLSDRERLATDTLSRLISQAGFQDYGAPVPMTRQIEAKLGLDPEPDLFAWNDAAYTQPTSLAISTITQIADGDRPTKCGSVTDTSCRNGSDVLVVRYQGVGTVAAPDGTMLNCMGTAEPGMTTGSLDARAINILFIDRDASGEPSLYCSRYNHETGAWVAKQALIEGVESMQFLFGTDNVVAGTAPAAAWGDTIADRWLRADQLKVAANPVATRENWRRVRAVRVGLVFRGPSGSAQERVASSLAPLGSPTYVATADVGSRLDTAADARLRRVANFTVHVRNDLTTR